MLLRQKEKVMRKVLSIAAIILIAFGYAAGADYWHFGIGAKFDGVVPGKDYSNALGGGILLTFGNPDSKFTTQFDFDKWGVQYTKSGDRIKTSPLGQTDTYKTREHKYSGLGVALLERYRAVDFSNAFSGYIIGGFGGYFLDYKREEADNGTVTMKSKGLHSLGQITGGIGLEGQINPHTMAFLEARFVGFIDPQDSDKNLMNGFLGIRYIF
jgi:hypothetical protein